MRLRGLSRVLQPQLLTAQPRSLFMSVLTVSEALSFSLWLPCPKRFGGALLLPWLL